jgi:murein DD-endopeptidase MepM/ murein hydrolase activator NlpD
MAKVRYKFNPRSLEIEKVEITMKQRLMQVGSYLLTAIVFAVITTTIAFQVIDSPKEKALKREIEQYRLQNQVITDQLDKIEKVMVDLQYRDDNIYRVLFGAEPVSDAERHSGIGGVDRYHHLEGYTYSDELIRTARRVDEISRKMVVQSKSFDKVFALAKQKEQMMASIPAIVPIKNGAMNIVSGFGYRIHPIYRTRRMHTGVDIAVKRGTPVYASGDGTVVQPSSGMGGYGLHVLVDHGFGYQSLYAHLSKTAVKPGRKVKRGELIGYVGSSGLSVAPHLHYEVIKNNQQVNPVHYFYNDLNPAEYEEVIKIASRDNQPLS